MSDSLFDQDDLLKKWSLILGLDPRKDKDFDEVEWSEDDYKVHKTLSWVYGGSPGQKSGVRNININQWLKDIHEYFPHSVTTVLQRDAVSRFGLELLLKNDVFLDNVIPDIQLAASILRLKGILPDTARERARLLIDRLALHLIDKLSFESHKAIGHALRSPLPTHRPKANKIHWPNTILKNLKNYLPEQKSIIPEKLEGRQQRQKSIDTICLLIDQSGSMAESMVYAAIYGCIFSRIPAVKTHLILFDTEVADMTQLLYDPVELLFSSQMGGGTDLGKALTYAHQIVAEPSRTLLVLISDLDDTEDHGKMLTALDVVAASFKNILTILALNDEGTAMWNKDVASEFAERGIKCLAATPADFPELVAGSF